MTYYRIVFRTSETGETEWTDVFSEEMDNTQFQAMDWTKPIIRHRVGETTHFLSLDEHYLNAMVLGIQTFKQHETTTFQ